ncbi:MULTISPECIES: LytR/AlgR family response regulator transcription factor [Pedobacter]|uniref:LytTr DNA-binding region n=1 Tax=Pedobacter heparinus (strain ATCC 13125 / DSM 2366 / CIP 104194 / JCM 7457 / NBRC 12017 / NCIMB 9290 / NRRL B-14731 / HIM 762-3) TaxID=485917 RepID=C6XY39_PEDHD|nr:MULTISPECIES: LytTR family DNA-binding domain-containing protein [Pedobacter]ACU04457.1 LytTr DNA-binding region [Pedobacter heparinus DSM 2366]MBB5437687.1 DNA-binding LytR/AlgR family response regulator [Pedobacter sp. AK017]
MDSKLNCVIIDDEKHAVDLLADYIEAMPNLQLLKYFTDPLKALMEITLEDNIDVLFMDVDMPGMTGLDLSLAIRYKTKYLVFTTAHSKYAIDAFGVQANEYLLKPISMTKFALMINRLLKSEINLKREMKDEDFFFIKTDQVQKYVRVNLRDLVAIEGLNNYVKIHTVSGMHIAYLTMKELETKLEGNSSFIRVQRSFIISMDFINKVEGASITLNNKLEVPLGTTYRKQFLTFLERNTLRSNRNISD